MTPEAAGGRYKAATSGRAALRRASSLISILTSDITKSLRLTSDHQE